MMPEKKERGFAVMSEEERREISRKGGEARAEDREQGGSGRGSGGGSGTRGGSREDHAKAGRAGGKK
jgi:hypothetical protein